MLKNNAGASRVRRAVIMGAAGRDFHDFLVALRDDPTVEIVAFTATQIPGIDGRAVPRRAGRARAIPRASRSSPSPICRSWCATTTIDEVIFAYSDVAHADMMHKASLVLSLGADFRLHRSGCDDGAVDQAGHQRVRRPDGRRQVRHLSANLRAAARQGPQGRRHPPPHAVPRPERHARRALRERGRPRRARRDRRGARGVRAPGRGGRHRVRGRRLRGDSARSREGGRRHRVGRRQQRLAVLRVRPRDRGARPAPSRPRARVLSRARSTSCAPTCSSSTRSTPPSRAPSTT